MPRYRRRRKPKRQQIAVKRPRINQQIRVPEVRLLSAEGENLGVVPIEKARALAKEAGQDLVEISARATPPVAQIAEFGKVMYALEKKGREERKKHMRQGETKNVRVRPGTSEHDMGLKAGTIDKFLKKGYKVQVEVHLRGREKAFKDMAEKKLHELLTHVETPHKIEKEAAKSPRGLALTIMPS